MKAQVETVVPGTLPGGDPDPTLLAALVHEMAPLRASRPDIFQHAATAAAAGQPVDWAFLGTSVGTVPELLLELAGIKAAIRTWYDKQPDEVLREAAAYSARLTEIWTELRILESRGLRDYTQMRTMQVTPVIEEIDRQFKINQSRIAMLRQDIDLMSRGGGA